MPLRNHAPRLRRSALAFAACAGLLALARPTAAQAPPEPTPAQKLIAQADEIVGKVVQLRGLPTLHAIPKGVKDREMLRRSLEERIAVELAPEELEGERALLVRLGLMPADLDYGRLILDLLTEQIAGYYDTKEAELYLIEGLDALIAGPAMAHEIFHAVQDQSFDLEFVQVPSRGLAGSTTNGDRATARAALIEGDATVLMIDFTFHEQGALRYGGGASFIDVPPFAATVEAMLTRGALDLAGQGETLARAPRIVQQSLAFPYLSGLGFVVALRKNRDWRAVDQVYLDPPDSTEQILHPDKYLQRDDPTLTVLDVNAIQAALPKVGAPWRPLYENVMGELRIKLWLEQYATGAALGRDAAGKPLTSATAAAGWDGDRFYVLRSGDRDVVVATMLWDSPADAEQAATALARLAAIRYPTAVQRRAQGDFGGLDCFTVGDERVLVERWDSWVIYVEGFPAYHQDAASPPAEPVFNDIDPLRQAIWSSRRTGPYPHDAPTKRIVPAP